jgi:hypothetical protein
MGNSQSKRLPGIDDAAAQDGPFQRHRHKQARKAVNGRVETVDYKSDRGKRAFDILGGWKINVARIAALVAVVAYMLPVLNGTPLSGEPNARDGIHTFINIRDSVAAEPKNSGNGIEWRFGLTGWCAQTDAQIYGTPNT